MPKVEVTIPDDVEVEVDRLVDEGEFLNRKDAVEELLTTGLNVYDTSSPSEEEAGFEEEMRETGERTIASEEEDYRF